ncbi:efflux RND transporter periplasmic adaptor subunit [Rhizobium sp. FKL33]|jgi:RND family efflux transporter MFP subunit|uniref:efflux RND transporter periplasmic adaptor subunit n=1 Tax=Rhizobium sp. FKL33 TaxID=2562307 RepID=UPI0010C07BF9|nr:efflux RND transporter periplasmic adaptor subunit [Rhizobium sp. FKL33]
MKLTTIPPLLLIVAALAGCEQSHEGAEAPVRPVLTMVAEIRHPEVVGFTGTVEAAFSAELGFRVLGRITARNVNVGDVVRKGQVLATIDDSSLRLAVDKAKADLASETAKLDLAKLTEERQKKLLATNATTKESFEDSQQSREASEASVKQLQADLTKAQEQLSYAELRSEVDGVVSAVSAEVGQVVSAGQTILTVAGLGDRDAVVDIPDTYYALTAIGTPFVVTLQANPAIRVKGKVRETAPQADAATRSLRTKIALDSPPENYRLGSTVTATQDSPEKDEIWLPASAIGGADGAQFVWVVDPQTKKVATRTVTIEAAENGGVSVLSGLKVGERVVTAGVNSLSNDQTVRIAGEAP